MLERLTRTKAAILLVLIALACGWSMSVAPGKVFRSPGGATNSDRQLFREVARRVAAGESYYAASTDSQRRNHYPVRPFLTVRLPALTLLGARFGWPAMQVVLLLMLGGAIAAWYPLFASATRIEAIGGALAIFLGGAFVTQIELVVQPEVWAGFLIAIALALRGGRLWPLAVGCIAAALAVREFAISFVVLALAAAVLARRWREAACWAGLGLLFAGGLALHAHAVAAVTLPGDAWSPGWLGLRGPRAVLQDLSTHSLLGLLPPPGVYAIALLGPVGWLGLPAREGRFALAWMLAFSLAIAVAAQPWNNYWCMTLLPTWFIGYAFLPRVAVRLYGALAGRGAAL